ncbi:hypothetical protein [Mesorhizobium sp. Cs1299R1N3]|uniref:hypothetical protein n=1 Tax=Mesorhizobium sp. Cs1299R1N3 TaxID=3015173 RepID=UPI00301C46B5
MKLIFDINGAAEAGEDRLPSEVIEALGVRWIHYEKQMIADRVIFDHCTKVPEELPSFIRRGQIEDVSDADRISALERENEALRASLKETLEIASRNEAGPYVRRALDLLKMGEE